MSVNKVSNQHLLFQSHLEDCIKMRTKRKSYGHSWAVYYCSEEKVKLYGSIDKVPLYVCGVEYVVKLDENGCGVKQ